MPRVWSGEGGEKRGEFTTRTFNYIQLRIFSGCKNSIFWIQDKEKFQDFPLLIFNFPQEFISFVCTLIFHPEIEEEIIQNEKLLTELQQWYACDYCQMLAAFLIQTLFFHSKNMLAWKTGSERQRACHWTWRKIFFHIFIVRCFTFFHNLLHSW